MKYIWVQGRYYSQLGMYGGIVHLGNPTDVNNESLQRAVIWELQPFQWAEKTPKYIQNYFNLIRFFKVDVFGRSGFRTFIKSLKFNTFLGKN